MHIDIDTKFVEYSPPPPHPSAADTKSVVKKCREQQARGSRKNVGWNVYADVASRQLRVGARKSESVQIESERWNLDFFVTTEFNGQY